MKGCQCGIHVIALGSFHILRPSRDKGTFAPLPQDKLLLLLPHVKSDVFQQYSWLKPTLILEGGSGPGLGLLGHQYR